MHGLSKANSNLSSEDNGIATPSEPGSLYLIFAFARIVLSNLGIPIKFAPEAVNFSTNKSFFSPITIVFFSTYHTVLKLTFLCSD